MTYVLRRPRKQCHVRGEDFHGAADEIRIGTCCNRLGTGPERSFNYEQTVIKSG